MKVATIGKPVSRITRLIFKNPEYNHHQ